MSVFKQYAQYYDLLYQDKNYATESDYTAKLLRRFAPVAERILEFGSGTGRHGKLLACKCYNVTGVERSLEMVDSANQNQEKTGLGSFKCIQGDIRNIQIDGKFDAVIALFHVISYQATFKDVRATFQNAHLHLKPGGIFLFDVWYSPAVLTQKPSIRVKRVENDHVRVVRIAEPKQFTNENLVDVHYTILAEDLATQKMTLVEETHRMHHFSLPEITILASFTNFSVVHSEEFLTGNPPGEDTWGVCCVLRRT